MVCDVNLLASENMDTS